MAPDWVQKTFVFFWPISEQQISESVSYVLTQSGTRGSFVRHIASPGHQKCKALFVGNLNVNVPRSLATCSVKNLSRSSEEPIHRKICADQTNRTTVCARVLLLIRDPKDHSLLSNCA